MNFNEITKKHLEKLQSDIASTIKDKNINDTGNAVSSLEIEGNKLLGNDYIYYLDKGRSTGKFPPVQNIRDWVRRKLGIEDKKVNSVAFLVSRKIAKQGTLIKQDNSKGIELTRLVDNMLSELYNELPEVMIIQANKWL